MATTANDNGDSIGIVRERWLIDWYDCLERVEDAEAHWYDCRTISAWWPTGVTPFVGIAVVEANTEIEIKTCTRMRSNGPRDSPGHWLIKRDAHRKLLDTGGHYLLAVHDGPDAILARRVVPAAVLHDLLEDTWYDSGRDGVVCQLSWPNVIPELK